MKTFPFLLKVLLIGLAALVLGLMVCMAFILAGFKFESGQFPVFSMLAGALAGKMVACVFFVQKLSALCSKLGKERGLRVNDQDGGR